MVPPSWYFVAPADSLSVGGRTIEVVAGDRLLELRRDHHGTVLGRIADAPVDLCERGPLVLAWLGGGSPHFEVAGFDCADWTAMRMFHLDLPTTPAMVMRDLADIEHFEVVHGYTNVEVTQELRCEGASFTTELSFGWDTGIPNAYLPTRLCARVDGLGVQRTEIESLAGQLHSRHLLLPTPRIGGITRVTAAYSVKVERLLGPLERAKTSVLRAYVGRSFTRDLQRDAQLWTGQSRYRAGDSERLLRFRQWYQQFDPPRQSAHCPT